MNETKSKRRVAPEYYEIVFEKLHEKYNKLISASGVEKPKEIRRRLVQKYKSKINLVGESYEGLLEVLNELEEELSLSIKKHSCFYWIHLLRRLEPVLDERLGVRTDSVTTLEVRDIAEQAIFKYGRIAGKEDLHRSDIIPFRKILGGLLHKELSRDSRYLSLYTILLAKNRQLVIGDFRASDLAEMYKIIGLAYHYWYIGAKLRAVGKSVIVSVSDDSLVVEHRTAEQSELIISYDERTKNNDPVKGFASNVGTLTYQGEGVDENVIFFATLNVERYSYSLFSPDHEFKNDFSPNYLPAYIAVDKFYDSHKYLEKFFEKKHGFGLKEFCHASLLISQLLIGWNYPKIQGLESEGDLLFYQKFQRGYEFSPGGIENVKGLVVKMLHSNTPYGSFSASRTGEQLDKIFEFLTLSPKNQSFVSLWSNGPRFVFIPFQNHFICDYSAWFTIFRTLFFGLRNYDPTSQKGLQFEDTFAAMAKRNGLDVVIQSKKIQCGEQEREVDVGVRIGTHLYLLECKASERPLDFAIGNPKTIDSRIRDFTAKTSQATTLAEFVISNSKGDNYDFSWADEVVGIVVSPYVEWIWSKEDHFWLQSDPGTPRVLSANEAIAFLLKKKISIEKVELAVE